MDIKADKYNAEDFSGFFSVLANFLLSVPVSVVISCFILKFHPSCVVLIQPPLLSSAPRLLSSHCCVSSASRSSSPVN